MLTLAKIHVLPSVRTEQIHGTASHTSTADSELSYRQPTYVGYGTALG